MRPAWILRAASSSSSTAPRAAARARRRGCSTSVSPATSVAGESLLVRDPGTTRIGEQVRAILLNPDHDEMDMRSEMLLYMAARADDGGDDPPGAGAGKLVLCDRFVSSTLAYQLGGDGLTAEDIRAVADIAIRGRWPDLTIILDMPARSSMARVNRAKDRIEQRPIEYHEQVRRNYLAQAEADPARYRRGRRRPRPAGGARGRVGGGVRARCQGG